MYHKNNEKSRKWKVISVGVATLFAFSFSISTVQAQESVNATGGNATGSGGSASYSVGQIVYQTHTGSTGSLAQGVQQPFEISVVTAIEETKGINLSVMVYPNPTTDYLTLEVKEFDFSNLSFQLYDMSGKLLQNGRITDNRTSIVMSNLMSATYFVKVVRSQGTASQQEVKTFKIIKI
ncbi:MAG TPA: T9SS type A sorting domain-containing protein [Prolixibacteraceae bacterium]|nr:T9SS type A sorting domain-containing protein [Prolixibacteraceae bacterium]